MPDMFGAPAGISQAGKDMDSHALAQMQLAEGNLDMEAKGLAIDQTRLHIQRQEDMIRRMKALNQGPGAANPDGQASSLADQLYGYAHAAFQAGLPEEGMTYMKDATTLQTNASLMQSRLSRQRMEMSKWTANAMEHVHSQQDFDNVLQLFQNTFGQQSPLVGRQYSPEMVQQIKDYATTQYQQQQIKKSQAEEKAARSRGRLDDTRVGLVAQQEKESAARTKKLEKEGYAPAKVLTKAHSDLDNLIKRDFNPDNSPELTPRLKARAMDLHEQLDAAIGQQTGEDVNSLVRRVYKVAKDNHVFAGVVTAKDEGKTRSSPGKPVLREGESLSEILTDKDGTWQDLSAWGYGVRYIKDGEAYTEAEAEKRGFPVYSESGEEEDEE